MATTMPAARQPMRDFRLRVMLPLVVVTLVVSLLAPLGLYWAAVRSDAVSVERQTREMRNALKTGLDEVVQSQKMVTVWDEAVLELRQPFPDWEWVGENMGFALRASFGHNQFYVLDAQDKPLYAMTDGARVDPSIYDHIEAALQPLVHIVRGRTRSDTGVPGQQIGLPPSATLRAGDDPLYAADIMSLFRRPAAVSVMRNVPMTKDVKPMPGKEPLIISIRFLDGLFLLQLSRRHLIEAPRFSRQPDMQRGEASLPLLQNDDQFIGHMFWRPELPGTQILRAQGPVTALASGAMVVIMALLTYWLFRSMRQQQSTMDELRASEIQAQHLALHDTLTGLPNRAMFNARINHALVSNRPAALLLLDLDRFKNVNDTLGHGAGDTLIREFGSRLTQLVREKDTVARLGGDEFAILCCEIKGPGDVETLCQRILEAVAAPFCLMGTNVFVGVSIGVCTMPMGGSDRVDLMRKADIALYRAKAEGRDCYRIFTPAMDETVRLRGAVEEDLRSALRHGDGLILHFQPQVRCTNRQIVGFEALVRWQHPTRGLIPPQQFITIAEETGLIHELGEWVLREACHVARRWPDLVMAVNLSPVQFRTAGLAERLIAIVQDCGADPSHIELEVTESVLLDDSNVVRIALEQLRAVGFAVALDDFGTGYSSLGYLRRFQVDKIKIDRSFVQPLSDDVDAAAIVMAVLTLGHAMGLTVTAEGVETAEQQRFLAASGCDLMQGYFISPPVDESELAGMIMAAAEARGAA